MLILSEIEKSLPPIREALGEYLVVSYSQGVGKISGQFPAIGSELIEGVIGKDVMIEQAHKASELVAMNIVAQIHSIQEQIDVTSLLHIDCYVQSSINDKRLVDAVDTLSKILNRAFGKAGQHSRSLVIVHDLPLNATMEVVTTFTYDKKETK